MMGRKIVCRITAFVLAFVMTLSQTGIPSFAEPATGEGQGGEAALEDKTEVKILRSGTGDITKKTEFSLEITTNAKIVDTYSWDDTLGTSVTRSAKNKKSYSVEPAADQPGISNGTVSATIGYTDVNGESKKHTVQMKGLNVWTNRSGTVGISSTRPDNSQLIDPDVITAGDSLSVYVKGKNIPVPANSIHAVWEKETGGTWTKAGSGSEWTPDTAGHYRVSAKVDSDSASMTNGMELTADFKVQPIPVTAVFSDSTKEYDGTNVLDYPTKGNVLFERRDLSSPLSVKAAAQIAVIPGSIKMETGSADVGERQTSSAAVASLIAENFGLPKDTYLVENADLPSVEITPVHVSAKVSVPGKTFDGTKNVNGTEFHIDWSDNAGSLTLGVISNGNLYEYANQYVQFADIGNVDGDGFVHTASIAVEAKPGVSFVACSGNKENVNYIVDVSFEKAEISEVDYKDFYEIDGKSVYKESLGDKTTYWAKDHSVDPEVNLIAKSGYSLMNSLDDNGSNAIHVNVSDQGKAFYVKSGEGYISSVPIPEIQTDNSAPAAVRKQGPRTFKKERGSGETVIYSVSDKGSGTKAVAYAIADSDATVTGENQDRFSWKAISPNKEGDCEFQVNVPEYGHVWIRTEDNTGNAAFTKGDFLVYEDARPEKPVIDTKESQDPFVHGMSITAQDTGNNENGASGIRKITVSLTDSNGSPVGKDVAVIQSERDDWNGESFERDTAPSSVSDLKEFREYGITLDVKILKSIETDLRVVAFAEDYAGNVSEEAVCKISVDTVEPRVSARFEGTSERGGKYYYNAKTGGLTVSFHDTNTAGGYSVKIGDLVKTAAETENGVAVSFTAEELSKLGDGEQEIVVTAIDGAGNKSTKVEAEGVRFDGMRANVIFDQTSPAIVLFKTDAEKGTDSDLQVYPDTNSVYYNKPVSIVANIEDENILPDDITAVMTDETGKTDNARIVMDGKMAVLTFETNENHIYSNITISGKDIAGNRLTLLESYEHVQGADDLKKSAEGEYTAAAKKVIDTNSPTATIGYESDAEPHLYDEEDGQESAYFNKKVGISIEIEDDMPLDTKKLTGGIEGKEEHISVKDGASKAKYDTAVDSGLSGIVVLSAMDRALNPVYVREMLLSEKEETFGPAVESESYKGRYNIIVDSKNPTFSLDIKADGAADTSFHKKDGRFYFNVPADVSIHFDEDHFDPDLVSIKKGAVSSGEYDSQKASVETFTESISVSYPQSVDKAETDGVYQYIISGTDKAGNPITASSDEMIVETENGGAFKSVLFVIDRTNPEGVIRIGSNGKTFYEMLTNGELNVSEPYQKTKRAEISVFADTDVEHSPVNIRFKSVSVPDKYSSGVDSDAYKYGQAISEIKKGSQKFRLTDIVLTDLAGNKTEVTDTNTIYLDEEPPEVDELSPVIQVAAVSAPTSIAGDGRDLFNSDVPLTIEVKEPYANEHSSGLSEVSYDVYLNGKLVEGEHKVLREKNTTRFTSKYSDQELVYEYSGKETVKKGSYNSNDLAVVVHASDNAGNESSKTYKFGIDASKPVIEVSYSNNSAENSIYFKRPRKALVTVRERNFDPEKITISAGDGAKIGGWERTQTSQGNGDDDVWGTTVQFNDDGEYHVAVTGTDGLGNAAAETIYKGTAPKHFVIDQKTPAIKVEFDDNAAKNKKYYSKNRTAVVTIEDSNFDETRSSVRITASKNNVKLNPPEVTKWEKDGNVYKCTIHFTDEGDYTLQVNSTDMAGNTADTLNADDFTIDKSAPSGKISIDGKNFATLPASREYTLFGNSSRKAVITGDDAVSKVDYIEYCMIPYNKQGNVPVSIDALKSAKWEKYKQGVSLNTDISGVLYARIVDMAGNEAYIGTDGFAFETTEPEKPVFTFTGEKHNGIFTKDVKVSVSAKEQTKTGYSGLKTLEMILSQNRLSGGKARHDAAANTPFTKELKINDTIRSAGLDGETLTLNASTSDYAGNAADNNISVKIDTVKPVIRVESDETKPTNKKYFNKARSLVVTVEEHDFDSNLVLYTINVDGKKHTATLNDINHKKIPGVTADKKYKEITSGVYTAKITFGSDGKTDHDYTFAVQAEDTAGNKATDITYTGAAVRDFTIDEIAPVLKLRMTTKTRSLDLARSAKEAPQISGDVINQFLVKERNFRGTDIDGVMRVSVKGVDSQGAPEGSANITGVQNLAKWTGTKDAYVSPDMILSSDANYEISAEYVDLAGNKVSIGSYYVTVDKTKPTGLLTANGGGNKITSNKLHRSVPSNTVSRNGFDLALSRADKTSGVASVAYYKQKLPDGADSAAGLTEAKLASVKWAKWTDGLKLNPDNHTVIYVKITDRAGNTEYICTPVILVADHTSPGKPVISLTGGKIRNGIYSTDVPFSISAEDMAENGAYAGLKAVSYTIRKDGRTTGSGSIGGTSSTKRVKKVSGSNIIKARENDSNNVEILVTAVDRAGNTVTASKKLMIDITQPVISVSYDVTNENRFYNKTRTATVRVTERNFDPSGVSWNIHGTPAPKISGWSHNGDVHTATVSFAEEGDFSLGLTVTDRAGNSRSYSETGTFQIDKTAPAITVEFDKQKAQHKKYFNKKRTATITVKEKNFKENLISVDLSAKKQGKSIDMPAVSAWKSDGDVHKANVVFEADGDYTMLIKASDIAGNQADAKTVPEFVIDTKAPVLEFSGMKDGSATNGAVNCAIDWSDINRDKNGITVTVTGKRHQAKQAEGTISETDKGLRFVMDDIKKDAGNDDIYNIKASVKDLAGNQTEKSITISVNRFGSNYTFDDKAEALLKKVYTNKVEDFILHETNVSKLKNQKVTVLHSGKAMPLTEGKDYKITLSDNGGWYEYTYEISKDCFKEDGTYEIHVQSEDESGNSQANQIKNKEIRFVLDTTPPSAVLTGIENRGRYKENEREVGIVATDNVGIAYTTLMVDGKETQRFEGSETVAEMKGSYRLGSSGSWQNVELISYDLAGNASEPAKMKVLVSPSWVVQTLHNVPVLVPVPVAALLAFILFFLKKRKKDEDQSSEAPTDNNQQEEGHEQ